MPNPTSGDVHVNALLTNISIAYVQAEAAFVSGQVFPVIPVQKQSDYYMSYDKEDWLRSKAQKRAPGAESAGGGFKIKTDNTYFCDVWAYHQDVDDQTRANVDAPLNLDRDATENVTRQMLLAREIDWVSTFLVNSVWGSNVTPNPRWDAASSYPIADVQTGVDLVESNTGYRPNTLVVTPDVFRVLKSHSTILDRIKYTQRGVVTTDLLASLFEVQKVLVVRAVVDATKEGQLSNPDYLASNKALLVYAEPAPGIMKPSGGYTFSWTGLLGGSAGARVKRFRLEQLESDCIEVEAAWDHSLIATDLGYYFHTPLT